MENDQEEGSDGEEKLQKSGREISGHKKNPSVSLKGSINSKGFQYQGDEH
jgi:hypothetical protein